LLDAGAETAILRHMSDTDYHELFPLGADDAPYRKLSGKHVTTGAFEGRRIVKMAPAALTMLAAQAFVDCAHLLRPGHLPFSTIRRRRRTIASSLSTC